MASAIILPSAADVAPPTPILRPNLHHSPGFHTKGMGFLSKMTNPLDGLSANNPRSTALMLSSSATMISSLVTSPFRSRRIDADVADKTTEAHQNDAIPRTPKVAAVTMFDLTLTNPIQMNIAPSAASIAIPNARLAPEGEIVQMGFDRSSQMSPRASAEDV